MLKYESIFTSFNFWGKCNLHRNTYSGDPLFGSLQLSRYLSTIGNCDCQPSIAQWKWESILDISWYTARKRKNKTTKKISIHTQSLCLEFIILSHDIYLGTYFRISVTDCWRNANFTKASKFYTRYICFLYILPLTLN